ncbi:MAG: 16S rRNA (cytidine(1402)-2'-O)-methyltransferase [Eubacteriales bacterium]
MPGHLYVVSTPIGNLDDITRRAVNILSGVDFVAAEDTRVTGKLLSLLGISKPMVSYFQHNLRERGEQIAARIAGGESCALVSDAGTPAISDPGEDLVRLCASQGITVHAVPGACAAVGALSVSGLPTGRFVFEGFLTTNKGERRTRLESLREEERTIIFYEAPHKLISTLQDIRSIMGERDVSLARELTKLHEEIIRTTLSGALELYSTVQPRGEYVLVVSGAAPSQKQDNWCGVDIPSHVSLYEEKGLSRMDAIKAVARERGVSKSVVYNAVVGNTGHDM